MPAEVGFEWALYLADLHAQAVSSILAFFGAVVAPAMPTLACRHARMHVHIFLCTYTRRHRHNNNNNKNNNECTDGKTAMRTIFENEYA